MNPTSDPLLPLTEPYLELLATPQAEGSQSVAVAYPDFEAGATIGRYLIVGELGRGGMGIVYLAEDLRLKRQVAIKVIRGELLEEYFDAEERFAREQHILSRMHHTHIIPIYSSHRDRRLGIRYYVSPYIPGGSISD